MVAVGTFGKLYGEGILQIIVDVTILFLLALFPYSVLCLI